MEEPVMEEPGAVLPGGLMEEPVMEEPGARWLEGGARCCLARWLGGGTLQNLDCGLWSGLWTGPWTGLFSMN